MRRIVILALGLCGWIVAALSAAQVPPQAKPAPTSIAPPTISIKSVVDTYCIACHNQKLRTAGLVLEGVDTTRPAANADVWERVIAKLRAGAMPPPGLPRQQRMAACARATTLSVYTSTCSVQTDYENAVHDEPRQTRTALLVWCCSSRARLICR